MSSPEKKQGYLLKAEEAEREAAKTKDNATKAGWLKIAKSYRQLAEEKAY